MCKGKIHRATVTQANLNYVGSITIDLDLLEASDIYPYEKVQVVNISNGSRLETYAIAGARGSGVICLNGAAARLNSEGDLVIIISYAQYDEQEIRSLTPRIVFVDASNRISEVKHVPLNEMLAEMHSYADETEAVLF
jgi:aspartate 1-decarboxylase